MYERESESLRRHVYAKTDYESLRENMGKEIKETREPGVWSAKCCVNSWYCLSVEEEVLSWSNINIRRNPLKSTISGSILAL